MRRIRFSNKVLLTLLVIMGLVLWFSGLLNLWIKGMSVIANDVKNYSINSYPIDGEYTIRADLSDLESNKGKVLYNNGENQIYIENVIVRKSNYEVYFRTSGTYDLKVATLVSGIEHARTENGFTHINHVNAKATYLGDTFKINLSGTSGLNYRDGASFGFYLFPNDKDIKVDIEKDSIIELKLSNLYMNKWEKN